jgi:hypothetical protein
VKKSRRWERGNPVHMPRWCTRMLFLAVHRAGKGVTNRTRAGAICQLGQERRSDSLGEWSDALQNRRGLLLVCWLTVLACSGNVAMTGAQCGDATVLVGGECLPADGEQFDVGTATASGRGGGLPKGADAGTGRVIGEGLGPNRDASVAEDGTKESEDGLAIDAFPGDTQSSCAAVCAAQDDACPTLREGESEIINCSQSCEYRYPCWESCDGAADCMPVVDWPYPRTNSPSHFRTPGGLLEAEPGARSCPDGRRIWTMKLRTGLSKFTVPAPWRVIEDGSPIGDLCDAPELHCVVAVGAYLIAPAGCVPVKNITVRAALEGTTTCP